MMNSASVLSLAIDKLKDLYSGKFDVIAILRAPRTHLESFSAEFGALLTTHEGALREFAKLIAHELEARPERFAGFARREARRMARGLARELPEVEPWLEYFRSVEAEFPGAVVLAQARAIGRLAALDEDRLPQVLSRIPTPRRVDDASDEERRGQDLDWLGKVIEGVFVPVGLDALSFVESMRTGKRFHFLENRGAQFDAVLESLKSSPASPILDSDLLRIRNAIEHGSFSPAGGSVRLRGKMGKRKADWSREIAFEHLTAKGTEVMLSAAAIALSMQVVMLESAPALLLQPALLKVLIAVLRGEDPAPYDVAAEAAFKGHLTATLRRLDDIS